MAAELGDAVAEAAKLARRMGSATVDAILLMACLGEELPFLEPVLKTITAIREKVDTVKKNREELAALEERCTFLTAWVIEKHRRNSNTKMDVAPLTDCVKAVEEFTVLCASKQENFLRRFSKASDSKDKIARLNARVDQLTGDLQLAGVVTVEGKIDSLKASLVSFIFSAFIQMPILVETRTTSLYLLSLIHI